MLWLTIGLLFGLVGWWLYPVMSVWALCILFSSMMALMLPLFRRNTMLWLCLCGLFIGVFRMQNALMAFEQAQIMQPTTARIIVHIEQLDPVRFSRLSGVVSVVDAPDHPQWLGHQLRFVWPKASHVTMGQRWQWHGVLDAWRPPPGGSIWQAYGQNRIGRMEVQAAQLMAQAHSWQRWRQDVLNQWQNQAGIHYLGVVLALAVGERSGVDRSLWELFQKTGTSHLLAISGLHVGLVYRLFAWIGGLCWWIGVYYNPRLNRLGWMGFFGLSAATLYTLISGGAGSLSVL